MKDKLNLLTECERLGLPLALFAMLIGKIDSNIEQTAITKETNVIFTFTELNNYYGKKSIEGRD